MKNLRNILSAAVLMTVIAFGTTFANAGILISDRPEVDPCTEESSSILGIIVNDILGIIVNDIKGIIVNDRKDGIIVKDAPETCGIIVND